MTAVRRLADRVMGSLGRLLVRIFFRQIEVEGLEQIGPDVPTVLVANHLNGLVDGLLLMATLPRFPRFLGKSTLFGIPPMWPFLKLAGVVPVYRAKDGSATSQNTATFRTCRMLLARRGLVALFPEGISHDEPELQPLKTGAARIALGACVDDGVPGVVVQPVGIVYDEKARFRSVALVRVGAAVAVDQWANQYRIDDHQAVRALTAQTATSLAALSPSYGSWSDATMLRQIADVLSRGTETAVPVTVAFSDRDQLARALSGADESSTTEDSLELRRAFARYSEDLETVGLTDAQLVASYRGWWVGSLLAWSVVKIVLGAPFALAGAIVHFVPYEIIKQVAKTPTNEGIKATVKLLGCFATFSMLYAGIGVAFALNFGTWEGLVAGLGSAICGYVTVRFSERVKRVGGAVAGYRVVRHARLSTVRAHRGELVVAAQRLLSGSGDAPAPA
jgi:1-acyl-sn-glycerol-3-phosphate acyltransferase